MASDNATRVPLERTGIDSRTVVICGVSTLLALLTGFIAQALVGLIGLITNVAFYGRFSTAFVSPAGNTGHRRHRGRHYGAVRIEGNPRTRNS